MANQRTTLILYTLGMTALVILLAVYGLTHPYKG